MLDAEGPDGRQVASTAAFEAYAPTSTDVPRLPFIDGLRGLAALVVCLGHLVLVNASIMSTSASSIFQATPLQLLVWPFQPWGADMVNLFLLVSGFSLAYSEDARREKGRAPTSLRGFTLRRAYRLAPIYYVGLALGLVVFSLPLAVSVANSPIFRQSTDITYAGTVAHLFFIHNLRPGWINQGNTPLWSMAYEVQLYLTFPLLYAAMKRFNPLLVAAAAIAIVAAISHLNLGYPVFGLMRWFVAGIALAAVYRRVRVPRWLLGAIAVISFAIALSNTRRLQSGNKHDVIWMILFVSTILFMASRPASRNNPLNHRIFGWLGERSYSLYVLHFPLVFLLFAAVSHAGVQGAAVDGVVLLVGLPLSLLAAHLGYLWLERPALRRARAVQNQ